MRQTQISRQLDSLDLMNIRSVIENPTRPSHFLWATGLEDTFIASPWPKTLRILDEYELTGHYDKWKQDIASMAALNLRTVRYGVPWYRINPAKNRWNWEWADRPLERLLELGIDPIVDLVHYGVPLWIDRAFLHPDFPKQMAEYAWRLGDRFKGRIHAFTPLNEPRITAWYCGKLGWWPPYQRGWKGFLAVLVAICNGVTETERALRSVDSRNVIVHVDPADLYSTLDPSLADETKRRQQLVFLALDLISGRVGADHALYVWIRKNGISETSLRSFVDDPVALDVIGLNAYPMFSNKRLVRSNDGLRVRQAYGDGEMLADLIRLYWERYKRPLMIAETATVGSVPRRLRWLNQSVDSVKQVRLSGIPVVGYTWWPMVSHIAWAYRQGQQPVSAYIQNMGLWDLSRDGNLTRLETPLVVAYRKLIANTVDAVGRVTTGP
jgi:beta-glucosidase